jgi:uncharacterized protein YbaP (TraB family)
MRRLLVVCLLISPCALFSADPPFQAKLWKVSSATNSIYVLGSIHVGTPEMYPLPKPIEEAFTASSTLLVEIYDGPQGNPTDGLVTDIVKSKGMYGENDSLWKHISRRARTRLLEFCKKNSFFEKNEMTPDDLATMKPWIVALMVDIAPAFSAGMEGELGIDEHFKKEAEQAGKRIVGIETTEFQMRLLSGFPDKLQVQWLEKELAGDGIGVAKIEKALIPDRNVHMAEVAEDYLKRSELAFIVVGAAHLEGEKGIIHLLEQRGFKAEVASAPVSK